MTTPGYLSPDGDSCILEVYLQPRSSSDAVVGLHGTALKIRITAPPVDDRANRALESFVAGLLAVPKGRVAVVGGHSSRRKRLRIEGLGVAVAARVLDVPGS
ncbi:MAG: YggU family protein [Actinobacteria bacterium]|nr:YggU family protein [Actinomycetota bacterium]